MGASQSPFSAVYSCWVCPSWNNLSLFHDAILDWFVFTCFFYTVSLHILPFDNAFFLLIPLFSSLYREKYYPTPVIASKPMPHSQLVYILMICTLNISAPYFLLTSGLLILFPERNGIDGFSIQLLKFDSQQQQQQKQQIIRTVLCNSLPAVCFVYLFIFVFIL